jgi:WD40 repeat protein
MAYSPDGRLFVAGDNGIAFVFDRSGREIRRYRPPDDSYFTGNWGPNGTLVLPDYRTGEIRVVNPATNHQTGAVYTGPAGYAEVAVGPDGRGGLRGVAASTANVISFWDVETGQAIGNPIVASSTPADATITNFNTALTSDTAHDRMILWDLDPAAWRVRACEAAGRNLTRDEWKNFLPEGEPYHVTCPQYRADE